MDSNVHSNFGNSGGGFEILLGGSSNLQPMDGNNTYHSRETVYSHVGSINDRRCVGGHDHWS